MFSANIGQIKKQNGKNTLLSIELNATAAQAAEQMSTNQVGSLVVLDCEGNFAGLISERDMLSKVLAKSLSPDKVLIKDIMTSSVIACDIHASVTEVENLMAQHRIRHIPILQDNRPAGMISTRDLLEYRLANNKAMQTAAEELAMLPTGLKSLDFEDVISLAVNNAPKSFDASKAVLCLYQQNDEMPLIYHNNCPNSHKELIENFKNETVFQKEIDFGLSCENCDKRTKNPSKIVIALNVYDQTQDNADQKVSHGFLCMCGFNEQSDKIDESKIYKATLLQQILNANLTNAKLYMNYKNARLDSETDPLTGVGTRRVLENVLKTECARSARYNRVFSIAIVDLDKFKQINDTAGHSAGDEALKQLAKLFRKNARNTDIIITRFGGDEFVLVIPETPMKGGKVFLERVRRQMRNISIPGIEQLTVSCGVTEWNPSPPDTPETIMARADEALYEAKRTGRNKVVMQSCVLINS
ncbi:MAG: GGDEF domain-containing protein [Phycisphaerae bacterium]